MNKYLTVTFGSMLFVVAMITACSSGDSASYNQPPPPPLPGEPQAVVEGKTKKLVFSWTGIDGADFYTLLENADGHSGFTQVGENIPNDTVSATRDIAVHLFDFVEAQYIVEACNVYGCTSSDLLSTADAMLNTIGLLKESTVGGSDLFGAATALSGEGHTLVVGAPGTDGIVTGYSGAAYVFRVGATGWVQQAKLTASNPDPDDEFGTAVAVSAGGNTIAVSARQEDSAATGINGDQTDDSARHSGAVYLFRFDGSDWIQQAYLKASNAAEWFGRDLALSVDGNTLVVGASDNSAATGIDGNQNDQSAIDSGAVYIFQFDHGLWTQTAYIKASNTNERDYFGDSIALNADGRVLAVGAHWEGSSATGVYGDETDNSVSGAGAVYIFRFDGESWSQETYVKASNTNERDHFGVSIALNADGSVLAVGARGEDSSATGVNGDETDNSVSGAGAVYIFRFDGESWSQETYIKASNPELGDYFGASVALNSDGYLLAVGAPGEDGSSRGVDGDQNDNNGFSAGAAYSFHFDGNGWVQQSYIKASNTTAEDIYSDVFGNLFGSAIGLSADGQTMAVGALLEDSIKEASGAVYIY